MRMIASTLPKDGVFLSLLFTFLLLPFAQEKVLFWGVPLYLPEITLVGALFFFFWRFFSHSLVKNERILPDKIVLLGAGLFFLGALLSFVSNPFSLTGLGMVKSWFFFPIIGAGLVFFEAQDREKRKWFILAWFGALVVTALASLSFVTLEVMTYDNRLSGMYPSPNFLAVFLAPGIFLMLDLLFSEEQREGGKWRDIFFKTLVLGGGSCLLASIYYTRSYGVWLALLLAVLFFVAVRRYFLSVKRSYRLVFCLLLLGIGSFFFFDSGTEKWQSLVSLEERSSLASRSMIWNSAGKMLQEHWFLGIGVGRFQTVYLEYQRFFPPYLEWAVPEPHNVYLAVLLSTGLIGFLGFGILLARSLFLEWRAVYQDEKKEKRLSALVFLSLTVFFLCYGLVDTPYFKNDLAFSFWFSLVLGLTALSSQSSLKESA